MLFDHESAALPLLEALRQSALNASSAWAGAKWGLTTRSRRALRRPQGSAMKACSAAYRGW